MALETIQLKRAAGEARERAHKELEKLEQDIMRQLSGDMEEGETRLTTEEINKRKQSIEDLLAQAKAAEGVDTLSGVMKRETDMSPAAREIVNDTLKGDDAGQPKSNPIFKSVGDFLRHVRADVGIGTDVSWHVDLDQRQRRVLQHLKNAATAIDRGEPAGKELGDLDMKTLVGDDTGSAGRGDFLIPVEYASELLRIMGEQQQFASRARQIPMTRRTVIFPRLAQGDATVTRPIFGFAAITKIGEAAQKPEHEPAFEQLSLTAVKYAAYLEASDELLADSIVDLPPVLVSLLTDAIAYEFDRDTMRGTGTGEPQGWLGSSAELVVPRETTQTITINDIFTMESVFFGSDGIYIHHPSAIPKLYGLQQNNLIAWNTDLTSRVPGTLLGRPLVRTVKLPPLGVKGDFNLVDPSFYLVGILQSITVANSIHYKFRNDVTAWRAVFRGTGTPWPGGTFSHEASGGSFVFEVSPFVVLGDTTTS